MITLKDSIEVEATPGEVFNWLVQRLQGKESYQAWHPDHVDIRWIKGALLQEGGEEFWVEVCGRPVPAKNTDDGIHAVKGDKAIEPDSVQRYLETKFGDDLEAVVAALQVLAKAYKPKELAHEAYPLYEKFRPAIPSAGWGAKGNLDLGFIEKLAKQN